jgi:hypothetical protein
MFYHSSSAQLEELAVNQISPQLLLHQQCWQWGQDIRRPEGNLLLAYGLERMRPPAGIAGSSTYFVGVAGGWIRLWGFGLVYAQNGRAVYLHRYQFEPLLVDPSAAREPIWTPDLLRPIGGWDPQTGAKALVWIANYERWVLREFGLSYRRSVLWNWHEPAVLPEQLPAAWETLAWEMERRNWETGASGGPQ